MALRAGGDFWNEADLLVPVPLHRKRIFFRKYNQSALITGELSKISSVKCDNSLLLRSINTKPQVKCTANRITSYNVCYTKLLRLAIHCRGHAEASTFSGVIHDDPAFFCVETEVFLSS